MRWPITADSNRPQFVIISEETQRLCLIFHYFITYGEFTDLLQIHSTAYSEDHTSECRDYFCPKSAHRECLLA